jgi:trehalose-6-phosphatase
MANCWSTPIVRESFMYTHAQVPDLGLAAEHGFFYRRRPKDEWSVKDANDTFTWKELVLPILQVGVPAVMGCCIQYAPRCTSKCL